MIVLFRGRL